LEKKGIIKKLKKENNVNVYEITSNELEKALIDEKFVLEM